jgi:hypothetical protein
MNRPPRANRISFEEHLVYTQKAYLTTSPFAFVLPLATRRDVFRIDCTGIGTPEKSAWSKLKLEHPRRFWKHCSKRVHACPCQAQQELQSD